jgi:hypothetical protein
LEPLYFFLSLIIPFPNFLHSDSIHFLHSKIRPPLSQRQYSPLSLPFYCQDPGRGLNLPVGSSSAISATWIPSLLIYAVLSMRTSHRPNISFSWDLSLCKSLLVGQHSKKGQPLFSEQHNLPLAPSKLTLGARKAAS